MPVDIYYAPKDDSRLPKLAQVHEGLSEAGMVCTVEKDTDDADTYWFNFEPKSTTTICASVKDEGIVFATVHASFDDEPEFGETLDRVLVGLGLTAEEEF